jgi:hypothetical protein
MSNRKSALLPKFFGGSIFLTVLRMTGISGI